MIPRLISYFKCPCAATAIEYGLIGAGISLAIAGAVLVFGEDLNTLFFSNLSGMLTDALN